MRRKRPTLPWKALVGALADRSRPATPFTSQLNTLSLSKVVARYTVSLGISGFTGSGLRTLTKNDSTPACCSSGTITPSASDADSWQLLDHLGHLGSFHRKRRDPRRELP